MKKEVQKYSAGLAVKISSQLISEFLDKDKQKQLVKKAILNLKKVEL